MKNRSLYSVLTRFGIVGAVLTALLLIVPVASAADAMIEYAENDDAPVARFNATDEDGDPIKWSLNGADAAKFAIDDDGVLSFKSPPSFEPAGDAGADNVYEVTVKANQGELELEVTVTDVEEEGTATLSQIQPQVEIPVRADATDPDGGETAVSWQWARSTDKSEWSDIDGATGAIYTPAVADIDSYLRATASYTDRRGPDKTASVISEYAAEAKTAANAPPAFPAEDANDDDTRMKPGWRLRRS